MVIKRKDEEREMMGETLKGESITDWHRQVLSWRLTPQTMNATVQVKNRNDLNSVGFPQSLNSTA